mmetsp:Transcript_77694/g.217152  ORF Transcript_77694/g.217152 Transcript_77694/m.217152 type:complete len:205 (+) Transcript_77694:2348-2962(+)
MGPSDVDADQRHGVVILVAAAVDSSWCIGVHFHVADLIRLHAISIRPVQLVPDHHRLGHPSAELVLAECQVASVHEGLGVRVGGEDRSAAHPAQHFGVAAVRQLWRLVSPSPVRAREHGDVLADTLRLHGDTLARLSRADRFAILQRVQAASGTERHSCGGGHAGLRRGDRRGRQGRGCVGRSQMGRGSRRNRGLRCTRGRCHG